MHLDAGADVKLRPVDAAADASIPDAYEDVLSPFVEKSCPMIVPSAPVLSCDPMKVGQCLPGFGCYPFPPEGRDPCNPGPYRLECAREGSGAQGAECGSSARCKAGFVCAVTGQGTQCVKICRPGQIEACSDGLVCGRLDVPGLGGCL